ncbi:MAG: phosphate uptake regulator PhoU [Crenarchaeota archaeon]|nr:phosphate uptake regulator PhoU [Thermoproteota archaeon]MDW8033467.1 phosphate uptake regulator PhoU [Nitrososphaerota archaeon]
MVWKRRVQKVGSGSFLVTLPKTWVEQNRIGEGTIVTMIVGKDGSLVIMPEGKDRVVEDRIEIDLSHKTLMPQDALLGSYLLGYNAIILKSNVEFSASDISEIRSVVRRLPGAEISEETLKHVEVRVLLDPEMVTPEKLIRRQNSLTTSMISDCINALIDWDPLLAERVIERDDEVDRQYFIAVRVIRSAFRNPELLAKMNIDLLKLMDLRMLVKYVEDSADQCVQISREVKKRERNIKVDLSDLKTIGEMLSDVHFKSVELFNNFNYGELRVLIKNYVEIENDILGLEKKTENRAKQVNLVKIFNNLTKILENAKDISELASTQAFRMSKIKNS